jgi:pyridoxal phosphate enzyme (YggS family)
VNEIVERIVRVRERMDAAARRAGRNPTDIALMAVTKTFPPELIAEAYDAGQRLFGENRVQEFMGKTKALAGLAGAEFHLIGHLQANKAGKAAQLFHAVDSVDSVRLAERLNAAAGQKRLPVLIEINIGGEEAKSGIAPGSAELEALLASAAKWPNLHFCGLMTIPPFTEDPEGARPYFRRMRQLRDEIAARGLPGVGIDMLSMGMSRDFEVAIEEGSTCVRVGAAIFGERPKRN